MSIRLAFDRAFRAAVALAALAIPLAVRAQDSPTVSAAEAENIVNTHVPASEPDAPPAMAPKRAPKDAIPMPLPEPQPFGKFGPRSPIAPSGEIVTYDIATRERTSRRPGFNGESFAPSAQTDGGPGAGPRLIAKSDWEAANPELKNFSALSLISDPSVDPYGRHVKLFMDFRDVSNQLVSFVCSGTLIDPFHVITAGHCVFSHSASGYTFNDYAESIEVIPGYKVNSAPFGNAFAAQLHSWGGWVSNENLDDDIGVIDLDRPIGALSGWRGYGYNDNCSFFTSGVWSNPGYPASSPYNGGAMYDSTGAFDGCEYAGGGWYGNAVSFFRQSFGGQSGSGEVLNSSGSVFAILSNGNTSLTNCIRIVSDKFTDIQDFISQDKPASFDLIPLAVLAAPTTVNAGQQFGSMSYLVHNYSTQIYNGTFNVEVYVSNDPTISISDTLIQTHSVTTSLNPLSTLTVNVSTPPTLPPQTTGGTKYIGVRLALNDANVSNNAASGQDAFAINVTTNILPDPFEQDDSFGQAKTLTAGVPQMRTIDAGGDADYLVFTLAQASEVIIETSGTSGDPVGDTEMFLYNSGQSQIAYNDDIDFSTNRFSLLSFTCASPLAAGTYYLKIQDYQNNGTIPGYFLRLEAKPCSDPGLLSPMINLDFQGNSAASAGWFGGALGGNQGSVSSAGGLCMTVIDGADIGSIGWVSPPNFTPSLPGFVPLVDNAAYRVELQLTSSQSAQDKIPFVAVEYSNAQINQGFDGNTYGGFMWLLDVAGGAVGVGRFQSTYDFWVAPVAARTNQWRGIVDGPNGAFTALADVKNDFNVTFKLYKGNDAIGTSFDAGTVCVRRMTVERVDIPSLSRTLLYGPPISSYNQGGAYFVRPDDFGTPGGGSGAINEATDTFRAALTANAAADPNGSRKQLLYFDAAQGVTDNQYRMIFPIPWTFGTLYMYEAMIRSDVIGGGDGSDPVDMILVDFDTPTVETGAFHFTTKGGFNNFQRASSPRASAQPYIGFCQGFYPSLAETIDSNGWADADRLRMFIDFFNTGGLGTGLGSETDGLDPVAVTGVKIYTIDTSGL